MRLYRFIYLLVSMFVDTKCSYVKMFKMEFTGDGLFLHSDTDSHCYSIFYGTIIKGVQNWQDLSKSKDQSVLLYRCDLVGCADLPPNFYTIKCDFKPQSM